MPLPSDADVIVVRGFWLDEVTGQGVRTPNSPGPGTVTFTPLALNSLTATQRTPNLRDLTTSGWIKTRSRVATVHTVTGYFATLMVSNNDPDLDAYGGRLVQFVGEEAFVIEVPHNAPTVSADQQMVDALTNELPDLDVGDQIKAVWLTAASLVTTPVPSPPVTYLTAGQTLETVVSGIEAHDDAPGAHGGRLIPTGGTTGQALVKTAGGNYAVGWGSVSGGGSAALTQWAANPDALIVGTITRNSDGAATSAPVVWPDGQPGTYTATTLSSSFPGAVDAYTITKGSPVTQTYTQPAVTRNASGAVTTRPAVTVS